MFLQNMREFEIVREILAIIIKEHETDVQQIKGGFSTMAVHFLSHESHDKNVYIIYF